MAQEYVNSINGSIPLMPVRLIENGEDLSINAHEFNPSIHEKVEDTPKRARIKKDDDAEKVVEEKEVDEKAPKRARLKE